jgi:hypothetical protein
MSEADNNDVNTTPLDTFIDSPPAVVPVPLPVDPLAAPEADPLEQRVTAIEEKLVELQAMIAKLQAQAEDITEAWTQFAQAGTRVLEQCRDLAAGSDNAAVVELDRRLRVIESSRM